MRQDHVLESEVLTSQSRPGGSAIGQKCGQQMRLHHRQASLHRRPMCVGSAELNALTDMALLRITQRPVSYATSPGRCGKVALDQIGEQGDRDVVLGRHTQNTKYVLPY